MAKKPSDDLLLKATKMISGTFQSYLDRGMQRKTQLLRVYDEYSTFKENVENEWSTSFKVNKAHEIIENVMPSLTANNPRWIATVRDLEAFNTPEELQTENPLGDFAPEVFPAKMKAANEQAAVVQDYLTYLFEEYNLMDTLEIWAKNGAVDGKGYCRVIYKYEKAIIPKRTVVNGEDGQPILDENGDPEVETEMEEVVTGEYPTIEIVDWADLYYDARYISQEDRPAWIRVKENVRLSDIMRNKEEYFNLKELELVCAASQKERDRKDGFKEAIKGIQGLNIDKAAPVDENSLTLRYYYGWFNKKEDPTKEAYYEIVTCNDMLAIKMKELAFTPMEEWKCFPDPKSAHAVGFVEPILGMQEEYNFKKNSASEYINKSLRRQRIWSPMSGVDPQSLNDPIISTDKDGQTALANMPELNFGSIAPDYFQEMNDFERQIQSATHTVDVANPRSQQALTNTATGAKIKFFESNKVLDAVRKRWERALERIAYKLLEATYENMDDNIVFKKTDSEGYWFINKELLRDTLNKYQIKIEVNSSSFADLDSRREDALGWLTILQQIDAQLAATQSPQRINFIQALEDIGSTFEKKDVSKYITSQQQLPQALNMGAGPGIPAPEKSQGAAETLTKSVVGNI